MLLLYAAALAWRLAYQARLAGTPFLTDITADARIYWDWSGSILRLGPFGSTPFFLGPLYAYALAVLRPLSGDSIRGILSVQAAWDAAAVVFLADAARRLTRRAVGLSMGVLACFYEMSVFFTGLALTESLLFFLQSLLLWFVVSHSGWKRGPRGYTVVGLLIGLLAVGRANSLALLAPAILLVGQSEHGRRLASMTALLGALLLTIAPVTAYNLMVSGEWIPLTYNGGLNLYIGNNPHATGGWVPVIAPPPLNHPEANESGRPLDGRTDLEARLGRSISASESSRLWASFAWQFVAVHPQQAARLALRKVAMLWNRREYPQVENRDVYRRVAGPLGIPGVGTFAFFGALAVAGAWFAWPQGAEARFALGSVFALTLATIPFFVTDRFRFQLIPGITLLAAVGSERLWRGVREADLPSLMRCAAALACGALVVSLPAPHFSRARERWGIAADIGGRWMDVGRADLALPFLEEAVEYETRDEAVQRSAVNTRLERAELEYNLGLALLSLGRKADARPHLERAQQAAPEDPRIARALAYAR